MMRRLLLPGAWLVAILAACSNGATPQERQCPTKAQSLTFRVDGSCGSGGMMTVSTDPGLCDLKAPGALALGLPDTGYFGGTASMTKYDLTQGNWTLHRGSSDPGADPSYITCDAVPAGNGDITLNCTTNDCIPTDECGYSCMQGMCVMHLMSASEADAGLDAGSDAAMGDAGMNDSGAPADAAGN